MRKRNLPKTKSSKVRRQRDPIPWKYCLLSLACGLLLVAGFFYAARSHFSSMDYAMKNAELRKEIDELKSETRRLQLAREISLSPGEIKKAAKKLGLTEMSARNIQAVETKSIKAFFESSDEDKIDSVEEVKAEINNKKKEPVKTSKTSEKKEAAEKKKTENEDSKKKESRVSVRKDGSLKTQIAGK